MTHQALSLQVGEHGERRLERPFRGVVYVEHGAQIDDVEHIHAEIAEIVVDSLSQIFTRRPESMSLPPRPPTLVTMTKSSR